MGVSRGCLALVACVLGGCGGGLCPGCPPNLPEPTDMLFEQALARNAAIRAGYSWRYVKLNRPAELSDILVRFRGPALGLQMSF